MNRKSTRFFLFLSVFGFIHVRKLSVQNRMIKNENTSYINKMVEQITSILVSRFF